MSRQADTEGAFDSHMALAAKGGHTFVRAQQQVQDWITAQSRILGVSYANVPVPAAREWGELSAGRRAKLPTPELVFSNLARHGHEGKSYADLLRVVWGMGVIALDPTQDPKYVRTTIDRGDGLPNVRLAAIKNGIQEVDEGQIATRYLLLEGTTAVGKATLTSMEKDATPEVAAIREAWFSELRIVPAANTFAYRMAAHISGAEQSDAHELAFRTPLEAEASPVLSFQTAQVWWQFVAKGVAKEVVPFEAVDHGYRGHAVIPARVWRG